MNKFKKNDMVTTLNGIGKIIKYKKHFIYDYLYKISYIKRFNNEYAEVWHIEKYLRKTLVKPEYLHE